MNASFSQDIGSKQINVFIKFSGDEILVGKLILVDRVVYFKYDGDFIERGLNLSPFKLKLNAEVQHAPPDPFHGIFGVFDDSLPDGWGMLLLNRALAKKGSSLNDLTILDQLAFVGDTGKGALIFRPAIDTDVIIDEALDIDQLKMEMENVYAGISSDVIEKLLSLGGSSGGARPKANVGYNPETNELIYGRDILPDGFSHWIIKFPNTEDPLDIANIEYAYSVMAKMAQIEMSECRLLESTKGVQIFATKRFDRDGNSRLHMHSMAGLTHDNFRMSDVDYGHIINVAYRLEQSAAAREAVFRLAVFNVYSHNRDDHSKNFSWLMDSSGNWRSSPAYDLTYSSTSIDEHITRVAGEGANPGRTNLMELAGEFSISKGKEIIDQVQEVISQWPIVAKQCGASRSSIETIQNKLAQLRD